MSDESAVRALVAETVKRLGRIDILVNNAALYAKLSPRNYDEWDVATLGQGDGDQRTRAVADGRHVAPHMIAQKSGKIVNIASGTVYKGTTRMLPYVTSKGAVLAMTRSLSRELGPHGIAVNTLSPGYTLSETGLQNTVHVAEARERGRRTRALQRDQYPEDLIGALIFLVSSDSDFVTGQSLVVDGGSVNN